MLDEKLRVFYDEFSGLHTFIQHSIHHSKVHSLINSNSKYILKMAEKTSAAFALVLNQLMDSDDEK